ncbi:hypothetical protein PGH07_03610 [Sulfurovum sp. zt1-1]|uniref:Uncharacterized protein n=1 Tax=Sulfurovum zhangzhouensis TaxID=3019067 RepID=A0ABT7QXI3_9BACT|nr:hypothetical protein [Sulfurovum zhangzhouensis]MDM5271254.1 hypothetical protein [Sulfurovum zhangzhouensis]
MKNLLENFAVALVILLSLGILGLVIKYNMISNDEDIETKYAPEIIQSLQSQNTTTEKKTSYLDTLEEYEDVDVKVDSTEEESNENIAVVRVETKKEGVVQTIGSAVQNVEKKENYISNLEGYEEKDVKLNPKKEVSDLNVASEEDSTAGEEDENDESMVGPAQAGEPNSDPLSDIVNDIDSIIDASEEQK